MFGYPGTIHTVEGSFPFYVQCQEMAMLHGSVHVDAAPPSEGELATFDGQDFMILEVRQGERIHRGPMSRLINKRFYISCAPVTAHIQGATITSTVPIHLSGFRQTVMEDQTGSFAVHFSRALIRRQDCKRLPHIGDTYVISWLNLGEHRANSVIVTAATPSEHPKFYDLALQLNP